MTSKPGELTRMLGVQHAGPAGKLEHYAQAYGAGKISMARAAQESGVTMWEMMEYVRSRKISAQYGRDDLQEDVNEIYSRLGGHSKR